MSGRTDLPSGSHQVCPRCGAPPDDGPWCAACGLNLRKQGKLPTADAYSAQVRELEWKAQQASERERTRNARRAEAEQHRTEIARQREARSAQKSAERSSKRAEQAERVRRPLRPALIAVGGLLILVVAAAAAWHFTGWDAPLVGVSPLRDESEEVQLSDEERSGRQALASSLEEVHQEVNDSAVQEANALGGPSIGRVMVVRGSGECDDGPVPFDCRVEDGGGLVGGPREATYTITEFDNRCWAGVLVGTDLGTPREFRLESVHGTKPSDGAVDGCIGSDPGGSEPGAETSSEAACDPVVITPGTDDVIDNISVSSISCEEASAVLLDWGRADYPGEGPAGFTCVDAGRAPSPEGGSTGLRCSSSTQVITFGGASSGPQSPSGNQVNSEPMEGRCSDFEAEGLAVTEVEADGATCAETTEIIGRFLETGSAHAEVGDGWTCDNSGASGPLVCQSAAGGEILFRAS